ncbi:hypothetical protein NVV94_06645 [Pseudomonas sp. LS1212]|uniref:hypothetical protein n=1 Tax=Pseudomonas sp. LS1212 TaxID=2972478 RepID=UPI00215C5748|nr:hypothetical protein [Pseudomonas sp. LS1212]UVJ45250.1 hypothetical protein NVV94_06645 [Pseudomonas sp. LS1212]
MKRSIVSVIVVAVLALTTAQMLDRPPPPRTGPAPGAPGTPTPTPYPQVVAPTVPRAGSIDRGSPLLPPIKVPVPPRDQPLPGLEPRKEKPGVPGG